MFISNYANNIRIEGVKPIEQKSDVLYANFQDNNIKVLIDDSGKELLKVTSKYDDVGILNNVSDEKDVYLYSIIKKYKDEDYFFSDYHYNAYTKVNLYSRNGLYLDTIFNEDTNKKISPIICYKEYIFFTSTGYEVEEIDKDRYVSGDTKVVEDCYIRKLYVYDLKHKKVKCIYSTKENKQDLQFDNLNYEYCIDNETLYLVDMNYVENIDIESEEEKKNVLIISFTNPDCIKLIDCEYIGKNAEKAYVDLNNASLYEELFSASTSDQVKKVIIKDFEIKDAGNITSIEEIKQPIILKETSKRTSRTSLKGENYYYVIDGSGVFLNDYKISIYNQKGDMIAKDIKLCKKGTKVQYTAHIDEEYRDIIVCEKDGYNKHKFELEKQLHDNMFKFYYIMGSDELYTLYTIDGKVIESHIQDYMIDLTGQTDDYAKFKKNDVWYMVDERGEIIAQKFNVDQKFDFILYENEKLLLTDNKIFDKEGLKLELKNKIVHGTAKNYLIVNDALSYGLINIQGEWFYKQSMFETFVYDE